MGAGAGAGASSRAGAPVLVLPCGCEVRVRVRVGFVLVLGFVLVFRLVLMHGFVADTRANLGPCTFTVCAGASPYSINVGLAAGLDDRCPNDGKGPCKPSIMQVCGPCHPQYGAWYIMQVCGPCHPQYGAWYHAGMRPCCCVLHTNDREGRSNGEGTLASQAQRTCGRLCVPAVLCRCPRAQSVYTRYVWRPALACRVRTWSLFVHS